MLATHNSSGVVDNWAQAVAPHTLEVPPLGISPPTRRSVDNTSRFSDDVTSTRQLDEASTQATWPPTETEPPMDVSLGPLPSDDSPAFFESAEPSFDVQTLDELLVLFPEGEYKFLGRTTDGVPLRGKALLTHAIPDLPDLVLPIEGDENVDPNNTVRW